MKPLILPALCRLWRGRSTVQLGIDPRYATTLEFTDPRAAHILELLDGTRTAYRVARDASRYGMSHANALAMIDTLRVAGVLTDRDALQPTDLPEGLRRHVEGEIGALSLRRRPGGRSPAAMMRRRHRSLVLLHGRGVMLAPVAALLAASGVGRIALDVRGTVTRTEVSVAGLSPHDVGRPRAIAVADAVRRAAPNVDLPPPWGQTPDLAILVGVPQPEPTTATRYAQRRCPHLTTWVRDGAVVLGPLVRPGQSACLDCLNLHRHSRDPRWPLLAAQLATAPQHPEPVEAGVAMFGASLAAQHALRHLDGEVPTTVNGTLELSGPGVVRRRQWPPHPRCGCVRSPSRWTMAG